MLLVLWVLVWPLFASFRCDDGTVAARCQWFNGGAATRGALNGVSAISFPHEFQSSHSSFRRMSHPVCLLASIALTLFQSSHRRFDE